MPTNILDRRRFLTLSAVAAASAALASCGPTATPTHPTPAEPSAAPSSSPALPTATRVTGAPPTASLANTPVVPALSAQYKEAPTLAELVKAGKLPPVKQRLPQNPRVIKPMERTGAYGGVWRRAYSGMSDRWGPTKLIEEFMIQWEWADDGIKLAANTCDRWEQNADASAYTFYLRKGIKWSDGEEFNTDDVRFWYDDVCLYKDGKTTLSYGPPTDMNGNPAGLTVVDQYTFRLTFGHPFPLLPVFIARSGSSGLSGGPSFAMPEHYLKKFHPKYATQAELDKLAKDKGVQTWDQLWGSGGNLQGPITFWFLNPELPMITAWTMASPPPGEKIVMERNPFFWKVDPEGNQLPYIDQVTHDLFTSLETFNLWLVSGKIDMQYRFVNSAAYTLLKENEKRGDYRVLRWRAASTSAYHPNLNCPDAVLARLFDTASFRRALSVAINRKEIAELVYNGLAAPRQASPVHASPNYDAEFETKWTEYDPALANRLLDDLGLVRQADGSRKRLDGKPLEVVVLTTNAPGSVASDDNAQVKRYWDAIGVRTTIKAVERSLFEVQTGNGEHEIAYWPAGANSIIMADPSLYLGVGVLWAPLYGNWYSGASGKKVEPPADHPIRAIWALWAKCVVEPDERARNALLKQMLDIHKEHPYIIGTCGEDAALVVARNNFRNVPDNMIADDILRDYGLAKPCQFFFDR